MAAMRQWRRRLRALVRREAVERELDEEMAFHVAMETEANVRAGLDPAEARRRARLRFGGVERHKEAVRDARWLAWAPGLSLDFKLGFRMLLKYPGLTVVGGLAMAFAIALGAATFEFVTTFVYPSLPLREGDRIVAVRNWDAAASSAEPRALGDFAVWRAEVRTIEELGAYRDLQRNLVTAEGRGEPADVAEISASAFRVTRVPPLLGRTLIDADERAGAPPVVVIGHDLWRARFGGDSAVVGRSVRLGDVWTTVVGVMPEGYAFPFSHEVWTPLQEDRLAVAPGEGPPARVFGRLASDASLDAARAELATIGRRTAMDRPLTHANLRAQVLSHPRSYFDMSGWEMAGVMSSSNLLVVLVLLLVCGNVALLLFARAATREGEIVVRTALGASRGRIVMQLMAEALVLGVVAAIIGLAVAALVVRWGMSFLLMVGEELPFWFDDGLSPATVLYAALLTLFGAAVAGVTPALKVTRGLGARLKQASAGGGGLQFGGVWTAIIVVQVAVTVAVPVHAVYLRGESAQIRSPDVGIPAQAYLSARLETDVDGDTSQAQIAARLIATADRLDRRLALESDVIGVTFANVLPGMIHPLHLIEIEGAAAQPDSTPPGCYTPDSARTSCAASVSVATDFFEVLGAPILQGRGFHAGDLRSDGQAVIVSRSFVRRVLAGANPIGRRVRYVEPEGSGAEPGPWYEIVGVVGELGTITATDEGTGAGLYHPLEPDAGPVHMAVHVRGQPAAFAPRLRELATSVDPTLRLHQVVPLDRIHDGVLQSLAFLLWFNIAGLSLAVLLSLAGIYAVMSFTVARRTREIGIRVALGADRRTLVAAIFRRPLFQVALGVVAGAVLSGLALYMDGDRVLTARGWLLLAGYATLMFAICLLACIVPTRRALGVEPTEALRADG